MKNVKEKTISDITDSYILNIKKSNGELDILLGHSKHILSAYNRNFVKLIGGWYNENIGINVTFLLMIIEKYNIQTINFVGASKSCSGCIALTQGILKKKSSLLKFNLFLFSAYTTVDKKVYIKRNIEERIPGSLKSLWESKFYTENLIKKMEARRLIDIENVNIYLFYPSKSKYSEKVSALRIKGRNIYHIDIPVYMHNTLFPFWKEVKDDMTIELYENEFKEMHKDDYAFYLAMQKYEKYNFHLYSCIQNPSQFIEEFKIFKKLYKES